MFGFGFGELVVLVIVAIVVIGPKDLPRVLRTMGQWAGKLRRMASELRAQSGIDDVLRTEGLTEDLNEIRKLARGELDAVARDMKLDRPAPPLSAYEDSVVTIDREHEHPQLGPDTENAIPDTAFVYAEGFPRSKWAKDPVWMLGDEHGVVEAPAEKSPPLAPAEAAEPAKEAAKDASATAIEGSPPQPPRPA